MPALYNLDCDGLLDERFAVLGAAVDPLTTESFRTGLGDDIRRFHTRQAFDAAAWDQLVGRFHSSARRPCRTSWPSASATGCSSR